MSRFDSRFASGPLLHLWDEMSEKIEFKDVGASDFTGFNAIVDRPETALIGGRGIAHLESTPLLWIRKTDVPVIKRGARVRLYRYVSDSDMTELGIRRIVRQEGGAWQVSLQG